MKLYIKYIDEQIVDHPILEDNLKQVDPTFDPDNLPDTLKVFERVNAPIPGPYAYIQVSYQLGDDDVVRDVYTELPFTNACASLNPPTSLRDNEISSHFHPISYIYISSI